MEEWIIKLYSNMIMVSGQMKRGQQTLVSYNNGILDMTSKATVVNSFKKYFTTHSGIPVNSVKLGCQL